MADELKRIWVDLVHGNTGFYYMNGGSGVPYVPESEADALRNKIQFLEKVLTQAVQILPLDLSPPTSFEICGRQVNIPEEIRICGMIYNASDYPELTQYLKEKEDEPTT